jgi:hypothetical protein
VHGGHLDARMPQCDKTPTQRRPGNCCISSTCTSTRSHRSWKRLRTDAGRRTDAVRAGCAEKQPACAENCTRHTDSLTGCIEDSQRHAPHVVGRRTLRDRSALQRVNPGDVAVRPVGPTSRGRCWSRLQTRLAIGGLAVSRTVHAECARGTPLPPAYPSEYHDNSTTWLSERGGQPRSRAACPVDADQAGAASQ